MGQGYQTNDLVEIKSNYSNTFSKNIVPIYNLHNESFYEGIVNEILQKRNRQIEQVKIAFDMELYNSIWNVIFTSR